MPALGIFMMGIFTVGLAYTHAVGLSNAVREGARFGATTDRAKATDFDAWANAVIARTKATQLDSGVSTTTVCVQLGKTTATGKIAPNPSGPTFATGSSLSGTSSCPATLLSKANTAADIQPISADTCVVRVWAARPYKVLWWNGMMLRGSVARYERAGINSAC